MPTYTRTVEDVEVGGDGECRRAADEVVGDWRRPGSAGRRNLATRMRPRGPARSGTVRGALAALVLLAGAAPASAQCPAPGGVVTVRGSATVEQAPDGALVTVAVVTRAPAPEVAMRQHKERVGQARAILDRLAARGLSIEQGSFSLDEEHPPLAPDGHPAPPVARAETRFDLILRDPGSLDAVVSDIAGAGLFNVDSARFTVADRGGALDRARRAAMADARHQADLYADAGGLHLDGIERIADADAAGTDPVFSPKSSLRAASVGISPPKALEFQASVTVTWRMVPR